MSKKALREKIWGTLTANGVACFPGAFGRIPNFKGAQTAARHLTAVPMWGKARTLKCNPDSPQRYVRYAALKAGKVIYMAVPRLRSQEPFIELDPTGLDSVALWQASSIRGAFTLGKPVALQAMSTIDLIVAGSVAVSRDGSRLGKGGGYSDLEYALAREVDLIVEETPIVTTIHPLQIVPNGDIEMRDHDISLGWVATPEKVFQTDSPHLQPTGILWDELDKRLEKIPVLKNMVKHQSGHKRPYRRTGK
ncbi:MAG: 5-formyltetrahydrofolate cyclo-ligase [Proteobacteria bacterium]|nr:5-formyltetrahydrofolate cyclo-ligase [Pseudomonadota bacterium]